MASQTLFKSTEEPFSCASIPAKRSSGELWARANTRSGGASCKAAESLRLWAPRNAIRSMVQGCVRVDKSDAPGTR